MAPGARALPASAAQQTACVPTHCPPVRQLSITHRLVCHYQLGLSLLHFRLAGKHAPVRLCQPLAMRSCPACRLPSTTRPATQHTIHVAHHSPPLAPNSLQLLATGRVLKQVGLPAALAATPAVAAAAMVGVGLWPSPAAVGLAEVLRKARYKHCLLLLAAWLCADA